MSQIQILFQDKNFIAVHKFAGISVHNNEDPQNLLLLLERELGFEKLYPVHRLDKETSGIQLLALNSESARTLAEEFQSHAVQKIYNGVLRGKLKVSEGVWNRPLTDKAEGRKNPEGLGRDRIICETQFRVLKDSQYFTLCEFNLITGRQHQIRKHSALANHTIVGDPRYGEPKYNQRIASLYQSERMYLHCSQIKIAGHTIDCPAPVGFEKILNSKPF